MDTLRVRDPRWIFLGEQRTPLKPKRDEHDTYTKEEYDA